MKIRLNGKDCDVETGISILSLVKSLDLDPKNVAVERNMEIVPKSLHSDILLQDGDLVEIVEFVGGG